MEIVRHSFVSQAIHWSGCLLNFDLNLKWGILDFLQFVNVSFLTLYKTYKI